MSDDVSLPTCRPLRSRRVPIQLSALSLRRSLGGSGSGSGSGNGLMSGSPKDDESSVRRAVEATARAAQVAVEAAEERVRSSRAPSRRVSARRTPVNVASMLEEAKLDLSRLSLSPSPSPPALDRSRTLTARPERLALDSPDSEETLLEAQARELRQMREMHAKAEADLMARHANDLRLFRIKSKRKSLSPTNSLN